MGPVHSLVDDLPLVVDVRPIEDDRHAVFERARVQQDGARRVAGRTWRRTVVPSRSLTTAPLLTMTVTGRLQASRRRARVK